MNIVEFIKARIAEDEAWAQARIASDAWRKSVTMPPRFGEPEPRPARPDDPTRVLRRCEALRATTQALQELVEDGEAPSLVEATTLRHLTPIAAIWSDYPDYQEFA
ncbi:hypothetical protein F8M49_30030 [Rhodococcus zopfii]|uniref:Uncharacterized protein n=1 Tax=Rhodococcus zopfii TaxID=43772 RepID=A0ABU3WJQ5_9NOCA|nr:hypothetical protein [Rhodococcus zopfii]MDV2478601.1 hypothetical protein [Rhodococcus zopfii]